jgi:dimethylhistidine N-methyltransferase
VRALRAQFDPERERAAWRALIDELPRVRIVTAPGAGEKDAIDELAADVTSGLARADKHLHCRWFYDAEGSRLFEEICQQPEYYLPRAEREILSRHARDIVARCPPDSTLCELGSGSASKTRLVIEAMIARSGDGRYVPVDISPAALHESGADLALRYPSLRVLGIVGEYDHALPELWRRVPPPRLMLWLGSNIGNLDRAAATEFLGRLARRMTSDDRLLVGLDLRKDRRVLERAYDDAAGVTARFNLNLLARINRDLGADFDLGAFEHRASYDELDGRIDMWLVSRRDQRVTIGRSASILELHAGETIHTERSFKHHEDEIRAMVSAAGLEMMDAWLDDQRQFVDVLLANKGTI